MITSQQFWKGLGVSLISVLVTAFSTSPIQVDLLAVTAVCTILSYFGKNLVPWLHSDSPPSSLSLINVVSGVLLALSTAFTESVGTYLIEGKVLWAVVLKVTVYTTGTYLLSTFFAPPYNTEKKRLFASKTYINKYMKGAAVVILLLGLSAGVSAQKKNVPGILLPVNENPAVLKSNPDFQNRSIRGDSSYVIKLVRYSTSVSGGQILYNKVTKEFIPQTFTKVGIGMSFSFYKVQNGNAFNYLSINGFFFFPVSGGGTQITDQTMSVAVMAAAYKLFGTNLSPEIGINFEPSLLKSDYFPLAPMFGIKYNF